MKRVLGCMFSVLSVMLLLLAWMVFTPSGLQRVLGVLPSVTVNGVQGSLADGFDINTLQWTQPESASTAARHVQLQNLRVVPEWQALRHGTLRLQVLSAKQVDIVWPSTPNSPPLVLPNRMDLPLDVELKQVLVEALAVNGQTVQNVQLQAQVKGPRLEVQHLETTVQGMALKAKVHLGLVQPYVLDAGLHGVRQDEWLNIDGQLSVTGSLTQMQLALDARLTPNPTKAKQQVVEQTVHVETHLRPFDPHPFEQVRLQASRLNPKDWWSEAPRAQLDIRANVTATEDFSRLDGQVAVHNTNPSRVREGGLPVNQAQMELALFQKNHELEALQILHLTLKDQTASLEGHGFLKLTKDLPLEAEVLFDGLNPKRYWPPNPSSGLKPLDGELNGKLRVSGALKQRSGAIDLAFEHSHLANTPFVFEAKMQGNPKRLQNVWVKGDVLGNQLQVSGAYGEVGDALSVRLNWSKLPELGALLQQPLSGVLTAEAELRTQPWGVSGQAQTKVRQLRWGQSLAVGQLDANVQLGDQAQAPWEGELSAQGVGLPSPTEPAWVESLQVKLKGTQKQHTVQVEASSKQYLFSRRRALSASASLEGGMQCPQSASLAWCWQGRLNTLQLQGLWAPMRSLSLVQPAPLKLSPQGVELGLVDLKGEDNTRLQNTLFRLTDSQVRIEGKALALPVPRLSRLLNTDVSVEPNELVLGADWRYQSSADGVSGQVNIAHVSGGLQVLEDLQLDVPLQDLKAQVNFTRQAAQLDLMVNAKDFGLVSANLKLPIAQNPNTKAWGLAEHLPMEGAVGASFSKLNWLGPMLNGSLRTQGSGQVAVAIGGTLKVPDVQGRLFGMGLEVFHLDQGVRLEEGQVVVDFNTDQARIQTLDFTIRQRLVPRLHQEELMPLVKGPGKLTAQGVWNLSGLNGRLSVNLDRALVVQRPDRWVLASSTIQVEQPQQQGQAVNVRGDVTLHGAYIETPENSAATLDDDVVIKGRTNTTTAALPVDVQLQTHLGPLFFLNAEGLKTRLEGGLRLVLQEGGGRNNGLNGPRKAGRRLLATGTIRTEDGTYRAYGQELTIEHGVVNFQGPIDNPGLNVRAVRKGGAVEAGVLVTGSAQRPKVSLVSDPAVSDAEKLSWMLIGRGTNASDREQLLLLTAAQALFGNKEDSPTRKIAKRLGIDEFGLSTGSLTAADSRSVGSKVAQAPGADLLANSTGADDPLLSQRIITLGKKLSDKLFVSFDQSVTTAASVLKLNYQHSRPLSVILRTGADNAIDVLYQISFD